MLDWSRLQGSLWRRKQVHHSTVCAHPGSCDPGEEECFAALDHEGSSTLSPGLPPSTLHKSFQHGAGGFIPPRKTTARYRAILMDLANHTEEKLCWKSHSGSPLGISDVLLGIRYRCQQLLSNVHCPSQWGPLYLHALTQCTSVPPCLREQTPPVQIFRDYNQGSSSVYFLNYITEFSVMLQDMNVKKI